MEDLTRVFQKYSKILQLKTNLAVGTYRLIEIMKSKKVNRCYPGETKDFEIFNQRSMPDWLENLNMKYPRNLELNTTGISYSGTDEVQRLAVIFGWPDSLTLAREWSALVNSAISQENWNESVKMKSIITFWKVMLDDPSLH